MDGGRKLDEVMKCKKSTYLNGFHKGLGTGLGDGTEIGDEVRLGHTNTSISNGEGLGLLVGDQFNLQLRLSGKGRGIGERSISNLIKGIRSVGDEFSQEDFLVRIESVDDQTHQLGNIGIEFIGRHLEWQANK